MSDKNPTRYRRATDREVLEGGAEVRREYVVPEEADYEAARHALTGIIELELEVDTLAEAARAIVDAAWRLSDE